MFLILLLILIFSFSLLFKRQKEEKGKKRSKDEIRQNKEIPTFLISVSLLPMPHISYFTLLKA